MSQVSLGRPEFVPGTPLGHPTSKFLYVIFLYRFFLSLKGPSRTKNTTDSKCTTGSQFTTAIVKHYVGHFETTSFKGKLSSKSLQIVKDYGIECRSVLVRKGPLSGLRGQNCTQRFWREGFIVRPATLNNCKWCPQACPDSRRRCFLCGNDTVAVAMRFAMKNGPICFSLRKFLAISSAIQNFASDCGCDAVVHLALEFIA